MKNWLIIFLILFSSITLTAQEERLVPYRINEKWGYSDSNGKMVINAIYDSVTVLDHWFNEPIGFIYKGKCQGAINERGNIIITPKRYNNIQEFNSQTFCEDREDINFSSLILKKGRKYGIISNRQLSIEPSFDEFKIIQKETDNNEFIQMKDYLFGRKKDKWFRITDQNHVTAISKNEFEKMRTDNAEEKPIFITSSDHYRKPNKSQKRIEVPEILKDKIDSISSIELGIDYGEPYYLYYKNGKKGFIKAKNMNDGIIIPAIYDEVLSFTNNILALKGNTFVLIDKDGNTLWKAKCEYAKRFLPNIILYKSSDLKGLFFINTKSDTKPKYLDIEEVRFKLLYRVRTKKGWGYINEKGVEYFTD
jgi:hypothetical protein